MTTTTDTSVGTPTPVIEARGISKRYGPVRASDDVTFSVGIGEVVGLLGENGAGKSTLLNLLSGTASPDEGEIILRGQPVEFKGYEDATAKGVYRIFQHQALVPNISVAGNIYLAQEKYFTRFGFLDEKKMQRAAAELFDELDITSIKPDRLLGDYSFAQRQIVEIVRPLAQANLLGIEHPVILLDEPTSALSREQISFFFDLVHSIKHRAAQVFVSHRLEEVLELSDRLVVLKDGKAVATEDDPRSMSKEQLHTLLVGRSTKSEFDIVHRIPPSREGQPALRVRDLGSDAFESIDLDVMPGEIVGMAGVIGSGKSDVGRAIFEGGAGCSGEVEVFGERLRGGTRRSIKAGVGYVPPERHAEGIVEMLSIAKNLSLPEVGSVQRSVVLDISGEKKKAHAAVEQLKVKTPSIETPIGNLSGGNQQKVILARWTTLGSRVLILDNPTNGVDVQTKAEIYRLIRELTTEGVAVLLLSDDLPELIHMSDRIVVMKDGQVTSLMDVDPENPPTEVEVVASMV